MHDIHYLPPPDSVLEMEEMLPEEIKCLLYYIRCTGYYNIVFADLSSELNSRNIAVMEESDEIILIHTPNYISKSKIIGFVRKLSVTKKKRVKSI